MPHALTDTSTRIVWAMAGPLPQQPHRMKAAMLSHTLTGCGTCNTWFKDGSGVVDAAILCQGFHRAGTTAAAGSPLWSARATRQSEELKARNPFRGGPTTGRQPATRGFKTGDIHGYPAPVAVGCCLLHTVAGAATNNVGMPDAVCAAKTEMLTNSHGATTADVTAKQQCIKDSSCFAGLTLSCTCLRRGRPSGGYRFE